MTWRKAAFIAAAGIPAGLLWWLLAPSGLNLLSGNPELRSGGNTQGWLLRDLILAGLFLLAGCISGAARFRQQAQRPVRRGRAPGSRRWSTRRARRVGDRRAVRPVVGCTGEHLGQCQYRLLAAVPGRPAIWPAATALVVFLDTVSASRRRTRGTRLTSGMPNSPPGSGPGVTGGGTRPGGT